MAQGGPYEHASGDQACPLQKLPAVNYFMLAVDVRGLCKALRMTLSRWVAIIKHVRNILRMVVMIPSPTHVAPAANPPERISRSWIAG